MAETRGGKIPSRDLRDVANNEPERLEIDAGDPSHQQQRYDSAVARRKSRNQRRVIRQESRPYRAASKVKSGVGGTAKVAGTIAQRSSEYSGKGMLTAELLAGFLIVAIRVVADYSPVEDGTVKGNVGHPHGQYGPLPILAGLIGSFFFLSFLAVGGGTKAKVAVIMGGTIILTLAVNSFDEIKKAGTTFGSIGQITVPSPSGSEGSGASNANAGSSSSGSNSSSDTPASGADTAKTKSGGSAAGATSFGISEAQIAEAGKQIAMGPLHWPTGILDTVLSLKNLTIAAGENIAGNVKNDISDAFRSFKNFFSSTFGL